jgi:hypothetical protein
MKKDKWVWMPHAGHLIVGDKCKFHLNTYVGKYIVSTVGEYWPERIPREIHAKIYDQNWFIENKELRGDTFDHEYFKKFGYEEIGCGRTYETMVFEAFKIKDSQCCPYEINVGKQVDFDGYNNAKEAYEGHIKMCQKWSKK